MVYIVIPRFTVITPTDMCVHVYMYMCVYGFARRKYGKIHTKLLSVTLDAGES